MCDIRKYDETKFQILTEFICSVNPNGVMNFNNDIFGGTSTKSKIEPKKETVKNEVQKSENQQIIDLLTQINSKLDILVSAKINQK